MTEQDIVAALQDRARLALGQFADVSVGDDGSLGFSYAGALCSLRAVALSPGLEVLALTAVLAWDRPSSGTLRARVAVRNSESQTTDGPRPCWPGTVRRRERCGRE